MSLLRFLVFLIFNCVLVKSYSEHYYGDPARISQYTDDGLLLNSPYEDPESVYPYADEVRTFNKRSFPRWFHAFIYRNPTYRSGIAESKRFLPPFHPLARFRGLTMGGGSSGGGGGGLIAAPFRPRDNFDAFIPSPAHPVPSDTNMKMKTLPRLPETPEFEDEGHLVNENGTMQTDEDKMNAGDILRYLSSVSADKGTGGRTRIFRFGIK